MSQYTATINDDGEYDIFVDDVWIATVRTESESDTLLDYLNR